VIADIVPVLAAVSGLTSDEAELEFAEALAGAIEAEGEPNSKSFSEAVLMFRSAHPFSLADLQAGVKAQEDLDARHAGATGAP